MPTSRTAERGLVGDDLRRHAGPLPAILVVDVLQHFLAPFVLEVDVDVRGLVAFLADEALEEDVDALRIDGGDAQAKADRRVGRRAASLAQDAPAAGELHQVPDREEVGFVMQLGDQLQFVFDQLADLPVHRIYRFAFVRDR